MFILFRQNRNYRMQSGPWAEIILCACIVVSLLFWAGCSEIPAASNGSGDIPGISTENYSEESRKDLYQKRCDWCPVQGTSPNVSHFIYRDLNRNGIYDLGDRPMAGVAVKLLRPDKSSVTLRSNIHGFVNFTNSLTASPVTVSEAGEYKFEVIVPDSYDLTSDNTVQVANYKVSPTSRPGIIADKVPVPAGLTQALTIKGQVKMRTDNDNLSSVTPKDASVKAISFSGMVHDISLDETGCFSILADPGRWTIRVTSLYDNETIERVVTVEHVPVQLSSIILGDNQKTSFGDIQVIDFEEVTKSVITKMPNGVGELNWTNLIVTDNEFYGGEGYINNTVSGKYVAYNTSGYPVTIFHKDGFDFYGGYFGVAWLTAEGETMEVRAWQNDFLVADEKYELSALGPFRFDAGYHNITRLELSTLHYWQFVMDDFQFGFPSLPEP